jgi:hypothetical protein
VQSQRSKNKGKREEKPENGMSLILLQFHKTSAWLSSTEGVNNHCILQNPLATGKMVDLSAITSLVMCHPMNHRVLLPGPSCNHWRARVFMDLGLLQHLQRWGQPRTCWTACGVRYTTLQELTSKTSEPHCSELLSRSS